MALTKVGPAGIGSTPGTGYVIGDSFLHATGLNATNAYYTGIVTAQTFRVIGDFQVDGTTTTLDTEVTSVDKLEIGANNNTVGVAITQSGTGDILNLYDGSTEVFTVTDGGNVGIGTDNTVDQLTLGHTNNQLLGFETDNEPTIQSYNAKLHINSAGNDVVFDGTGNVGVGTNNPARKVEIFDTAATVLQLNSTNSGGTSLRIQNSGTDKMYMGLAGDFITGQGSNVTDSAIRASGALLFASGGGTERLRILANGKIGIGIDTPLADLHINKSSSTGYTTLNFSNSATDGRSIQVGLGGTAVGSSYQNKFYIYDNTASAVRGALDSSGNFGLGTLSPAKRLNVVESTGGNLFRLSGLNSYNLDISDTNANGAQFDFTIGSGAGAYTFNNSNGQLFSITGTGDVGINCTPHSNAGINLHIHGDNTSSEIRLTNTTTGNGANGGIIQESGTTLYVSNTENGNTVFETNATERLRITNAGELVSTNGTLRRNVSDSSFTVSGDSTSNTGANINLYGASHSSLANVFRVRTGSTERLRVDSSGCVRVGNTHSQTTSSNTKRIALGAKANIWGWTSGNIDGALTLADNYYWDGSNNRAIEG